MRAYSKTTILNRNTQSEQNFKTGNWVLKIKLTELFIFTSYTYKVRRIVYYKLYSEKKYSVETIDEIFYNYPLF